MKKTIFVRVEHDANFTHINNEIIRNVSLSWKARGLLTYLLSHSEGYQVRVDNLHLFAKDGPNSTTSGIKELKTAGHMYFVKDQDPDTKRWLAGHWVISEKPRKSLNLAFPGSGFSGPRLFRIQENPGPYKKNVRGRKPRKKEKEDQELFDPSFLRKIVPFVKKFFAFQQKQYPALIRKVTKSQIVQSVDTIDKLVRIDGHELSRVIKALTWAIDDDFWSRQILSLVGLRHRSKNGNTKFTNLLAGMGKTLPPEDRQSKNDKEDISKEDIPYGTALGWYDKPHPNEVRDDWVDVHNE